MQVQKLSVEYGAYCFLYMTSILNNKYVLSTLGFQYPTIFQAWQTFVGAALTQVVYGNPLLQVTLVEVVVWLPGMLLHMATIYCKSVALARLPVPVFLVSLAASDVVLMLFDSHLPNGISHLSMPFKLIATMLAVWYAQSKTAISCVAWMSACVIFSGAFQAVSFWYSRSTRTHFGLSAVQRDHLNNAFAVAVLVPSALFLGQHHDVVEFPHLQKFNFYLGCLFSAILGWAVKEAWKKVSKETLRDANLEVVRFAAKCLTLVVAMQIHAFPSSAVMWLCIAFGIVGDLLHIVGSAESDSSRDGMSNVFVGS